MAQPNGPRPKGTPAGRYRNTVVNNASKATPLPVVGPQSAVGYGAQEAQLTQSLYARLAQLKAEKGLVKSQFLQDRAAAQQTGIQAMASAVNRSLDTGMVGSSVDLAGRVGAVAARETAMQEAIQQRAYGMLGLKSGRITAMNEYYNGLFEVQARKAAEQAQMAQQAFLQDLVMRMNDEAAPRPSRTNATPVEPNAAPAAAAAARNAAVSDTTPAVTQQPNANPANAQNATARFLAPVIKNFPPAVRAIINKRILAGVPLGTIIAEIPSLLSGGGVSPPTMVQGPYAGYDPYASVR